MKPDFPEDPASVVRSQRKAWIAELEVLSRDPRVRKFAELRQKIEMADAWYRLGSPGQGGSAGIRRGSGFRRTNCPLSRRMIWRTSSSESYRRGRGETWSTF